MSSALLARAGAFRYYNADHAIESSPLAARIVLREYDLDSGNAAAQYLEIRRRARQSNGIVAVQPDHAIQSAVAEAPW